MLFVPEWSSTFGGDPVQWLTSQLFSLLPAVVLLGCYRRTLRVFCMINNVLLHISGRVCALLRTLPGFAKKHKTYIYPEHLKILLVNNKCCLHSRLKALPYTRHQNLKLFFLVCKFRLQTTESASLLVCFGFTLPVVLDKTTQIPGF